MKKILAIVLAMVMALSLVACSGPDKQPAIDAFNSANTAFTEVANAINANPSAFSAEDIASLNELAGVLGDHKAILESDEAITEEQLAEMIAWYVTVEELMAELKAEYKIK